MATITEIDATAFSTLLDQGAHDIQAKRPFRPQYSFYASSGWRCGLRQYWSRIGMTPTNYTYDPENSDDADLGTAYHDILEQRVIATGRVVKLPAWDPDKADKNGMQWATEFPLNQKTLTPEAYQRLKKVGFGARGDALVYTDELREDGTQQIAYLDFKTKSLKDFLPGNEASISGDLSHWEWQLQSVIELAEFPTIGKIDFGMIYLVSRDKDPFTKKRHKKLYFVEPNPLFIQPEMERLALLNAKVLKLEQPEPEPQRGPCHFGIKVGCEYWDICPLPEKDKKK